ncbi:20131_t:CDS:2, partial [Racocetra persica]
PKSTTSNTLTTSSQSTISAQATKLNVSLEFNSLPKKRKAANQLENILKKLDDAREIYNSVEVKSKEKKVSKKIADYLVQKAIRQLSSELFYEYKQISNKEVKKQLKDKLKNDKDCAKQLQYLKEKRFSFNKLWNKKFYSDISI